MPHIDDLAVDVFAAALKAKLARSREKGRKGWEGPECTDAFLCRQLIGHLEKGNAGTFEDIATYAMMLYHRKASPALLALALDTHIKATLEPSVVDCGACPMSGGCLVRCVKAEKH